MLIKIAWRNIWRNKTRSLVVIASVGIGLFAGMFMLAFFLGLVKQEIQSAVETQLSHIQIHNPDFIADKEVNDTIAQQQAVLEWLQKDARVQAAAGRIITAGMISSSSTASGVEVHGIIPANEKRVSSISHTMLEGIYFSGVKKNEIVIGKKLAEKLGVKLHSKIVLTLQTKSGELTAGSFRIAGIFRSRNSAFDNTTVFTQCNDLATLLGTGTGIHEIAILVKDGKHVDSLVKQLHKRYPALLVQPWNELSPEMAMLTGIFDQMMYIIIGIILLALMFGIINTMLMSVLERQREFGVLMAIGMNKTRVFLMIVLESVMLTCIGIPVGMLLTMGTVSYLSHHGIDLSAFSDALSQFGFSNIIYPELQTSMFLPVTIMTMITALLSALYPAYKALQCKPAVAIHKI